MTNLPENITHHITEPDTVLRLKTMGKHVVLLEQPQATVTITAAIEVTGKKRQELEVVIHHVAPHTRATTTLHGVVRDQAWLKIAGRIIIDPDSGDTHSFLTERILILSDQAHAEAVPDLEILTDDVSCSHAASISQIPSEHIFYLMSRGISRKKAERLIVSSFLRI